MKNKHCIVKITVMMAVICLLGINYGYWTEQLTVNGEASLVVQISVVDLVKTETVTKEGKTMATDVKSEDSSKVTNDKTMDDVAKHEKDTCKDLLTSDSSDKEKDLKDTRQENKESIIDGKVNEVTTLEVDKKKESSNIDKVTELEEYKDEKEYKVEEEYSDETNIENIDVIEVDKDNVKVESNTILDSEVDLEEPVEEKTIVINGAD